MVSVLELGVLLFSVFVGVLVSVTGLFAFTSIQTSRRRKRVEPLLVQRSGWTRRAFVDHFAQLGVEDRVAEGTCSCLQGQMPVDCFPFLPTDRIGDVNGVNVFAGESTSEVVDEALGFCDVNFRGFDVQDWSGVEDVVTVEDFVLWMDDQIRKLEQASADSR